MTRYGKVFLFICALDLATTIIGIQLGYLREGNPILAKFLREGGLISLAAAKVAFTLPAIIFLETVWEREWMSRSRLRYFYVAGIVAYCVLYAMLVIAAHQ